MGQTHTEGEGHIKINTELGVWLPQTEEHTEPTEAGGPKESISPEPSEGAWPRHPLVSDLRLHSRERKRFCRFKPPSFWHLVMAALSFAHFPEKWVCI